MHALPSSSPIPAHQPAPEPAVATAPRGATSVASSRARTWRDERTAELTHALAAATSDLERRQVQQELVTVNMPVAEAIASRYRDRGIPTADLTQVAYLALVKSARRYDPSSGFPFLAFCVPTVRGEVRRHFRDHGWMVRPPRRIQELQSAVLRSRSDLSVTLGRAPSPEEIATALDEDLGDVLEALDAKGCFHATSLESPVGERSEGTLGDLLESEEQPYLAVEARVVLQPALEELSPRDRHILRLRYVDGLTQREIAQIIGVTQMQVSRLLARIYSHMRTAIGHLAVDAPQAS